MLGERGFILYLAKRVHDSIWIKPYIIMLSWRLCHQDSASSSPQELKHTDMHGEFSWIWTGPVCGAKWNMLFLVIQYS